ncbi:MAG: M42 family metallopeptidase [Candidatus Aenigmarchaeota archaeon]|nr:M42 family metallopeptidase [Candidatus Aenigmarchaeota archaeon]
MSLYELLERLSNAYGVSGSESDVRKLIVSEIEPYVDTVKVDKMGNMTCHRKGTGPSIMLAAHMDEIGLLVKEIDKDGHIFFSLIGGISEETLAAHPVHILGTKGVVHGVITFDYLHLGLRPEKYPKYYEMYADTGLSKKELEKAGVSVGAYMIAERRLTRLGKSNIISGKSLDDRIGCAMLIELARRIKKAGVKANVYFVFTVQEEVGLYGARASMYSFDPACALAVETTTSHDYEDTGVGLGHGPSITIKDAEFITNRILTEYIVGLAKKNKIPYQVEVSDFGTTDALAISLSKGGVPAGVVSVPVRNIHSTVGIADLDDIENGLKLLFEFLKSPPKSCIG